MNPACSVKEYEKGKLSKMKKAVTFGEIMLRLQPPSYERFLQAKSFDAVYGGGEANVAVSLSQLGAEAKFVTRLPANPLGVACRNYLRGWGVDTSDIVFGGDRIGFVDTGFTQRATRCVPMEIYGDRGTISFEPHNGVWPNPKLYIDSPQLGVRGWMEPQTWVKNTRPPYFTQCCCLADIIRAIETDTDPVLSAEQARHVIEIMCAIPEAIRTGSLVSLKTVF